MEFLKQWTFCVCITLIISVIFSLFTPKGKMAEFYKIIISLFILISFLYPLSEFDFKGVDLSSFYSESYIEDSNKANTETMLNNQIKTVLNNNAVSGASVKSSINIEDDEIEVVSVQVAVPDEYDIKTVEKLIFDNLSINAQVIHIGQ